MTFHLNFAFKIWDKKESIDLLAEASKWNYLHIEAISNYEGVVSYLFVFTRAVWGWNELITKLYTWNPLHPDLIVKCNNFYKATCCDFHYVSNNVSNLTLDLATNNIHHLLLDFSTICSIYLFYSWGIVLLGLCQKVDGDSSSSSKILVHWKNKQTYLAYGIYSTCEFRRNRLVMPQVISCNVY